jgi:hypothetical protein
LSAPAAEASTATSARVRFAGCDECEPGRKAMASVVKRENSMVTPATSWPEEDLQTVDGMLDLSCHKVL